jgi:GT2 family glycosyltransferase
VEVQGRAPLLEVTISSAAEPLVFPREDHPVASIIIPVHNQWAQTLMCLRSILENTKGLTYEVIVGDDESTDETTELQERARNVYVARNATRRGFLGNCNNAATRARGQWLVFLNNDTVVHRRWLRSLVRVFERDHTAGIVGPKLVYPDGRLQEAGGIVWRDGSAWNYGRLDDPAKPEYNYVRETDYVSGACMAIRGELWREVGGFDERFAPGYYEDVDLAFEIRRRGFKVVYQPSARVTHLEGISHGTDLGSGIKRYQVVNQDAFAAKWAEELERDQLPPGSRVFLARGRSRRRKRVLVADHCVPQYDRDAGGRYTDHYIRLLVELGFEVTLLPSNLIRSEPHTSELQQLGVHVLYGTSVCPVDEWLARHAVYFDYVFLFRPNVAVDLLGALRGRGSRPKVIYCPVDLHFLREMRRYRAEGERDALRAAAEWQVIERQLIEEADVVHVLSDYEREVVEQLAPAKPVRTMPIYLLDRNGSEGAAPHDARRNLLFVGGFGHPPNENGLRWFAHEVLPLVRRAYSEVELLVVGEGSIEVVERLDVEGLVPAGRVSDARLADLYRHARLVVVPLCYGAGMKGKLIEPMYHGVPVVSTPIGIEGLTGVEGCVAVAIEPDAFAAQVVELERKLWERQAAAATEYVQTHFSRERALQLLSLDLDLDLGPRAGSAA